MPMACTICTSADRFEIDRLLAEGKAKSVIARKFNLGRDAMDRHERSHLIPEIRRAAENKKFANACTCQEAARKLLERGLQGLEACRSLEDLARLMSQTINAARLLGQTTKEVGSDQFLVMFQQFGVRDEKELVGLIASARQYERLSEDSRPEDLVEDAVAILKAAFAKRPELRKQVVGRLSSGAEEANVNGKPLSSCVS